jgi:hypothetical protein
MKKSFIRKPNKFDGKGPKGRGTNPGKNRNNPKHSHSSKLYNEKNDYEIESISGENSAEQEQNLNQFKDNKI